MIAFFLPLLSLSVQGQQFLNHISAQQVGDEVFLAWEIGTGNTCDGTRIQRLNEDSVYQVIGEIVGVCGSISEPEPYSFKDTRPLPGQNNIYRLEFGPLGTSVPIEVYFLPLGVLDFRLLAPPGAAELKLVTTLDLDASDLVSIHDINGRLLGQYTLTGTSPYTIPLDEEPIGMLIFSIQRNGALRYATRFIRTNR